MPTQRDNFRKNEIIMPLLKIRIPEGQLNRWLNVFKQSPILTSKYLKKATNKSTVYTHGIVQKETPVDSGQLRATTKWYVKSERGIIEPTKNYAKYVIGGTRPHTIFPKNKKALYWKGAKHPVKSVYHPGTKANPYLERSESRAKPMVERFYKQELVNLTNKLASKMR